MADCLTTNADIRARILEMHADEIPKARIARELSVPRTTVRDIIDARPRRERPIPTEEYLLDAAVQFVARFDCLPYSTALNPTRAANLGGDAWARCLEGYVDDTGQWRPWPQEYDYTRRFGSWDEATDKIEGERERLGIEQIPYLARPIPDDKRRYAALCGYSLRVLRGGVVARPALEPRFPPSIRLASARKRGGLGVIGDPGRGLSSILAYVVLHDLLDPTVVTVVIQRPDKPSIVEDLWPTDMVDLPALIANGISTYVESADRDVRMAAIGTAAQASIDTGRDVSLIIDDAEDVVDLLAILLCIGDAPRLHISAGWHPRADGVAHRTVPAAQHALHHPHQGSSRGPTVQLRVHDHLGPLGTA
jgi:hypothetical protein